MRAKNQPQAVGKEPAPTPLSYVEFNILLALAKSDMHGYAIMGDTTERTAGAVKLEPGNLYRALQRLQRKGWVAKAEREAAADADGERRRYYRLTDTGRAAAVEETARMDALVRTARSRSIDPEIA